MGEHTFRCSLQSEALWVGIKGTRKAKVTYHDKLIEQPRGASHSLTGGLRDTMHVYVINQSGHPLMPCKPAKARKLLQDGKATVTRRCPFTIRLLWDCEEHVQEVLVGIDKGSHATGICCTGKGALLLSAKLVHRLDVKEKMDRRRGWMRIYGLPASCVTATNVSSVERGIVAWKPTISSTESTEEKTRSPI